MIKTGNTYAFSNTRTITTATDGTIESFKTGKSNKGDFELLDAKKIGIDADNHPIYQLNFSDHNYHLGDLTGSKFGDVASIGGTFLGGIVLTAGLLAFGGPLGVGLGVITFGSTVVGGVYLGTNNLGAPSVETPINQDEVLFQELHHQGANHDTDSNADLNNHAPLSKVALDQVKGIADISPYKLDKILSDLTIAQAQLTTHLEEHASIDVIAHDNLTIAKAQLLFDEANHAEPAIIQADHDAIEQYTASVFAAESLDDASNSGTITIGDSSHTTHNHVLRK
jgi:hypothetical protein